MTGGGSEGTSVRRCAWRTGTAATRVSVATAAACASVAIAAAVALPAAAQLTSDAAGAAFVRTPPAVFLDCDSLVHCDPVGLQEKVSWVEWASNQEGADVWVTVRGNGSTEGDADLTYTVDLAGSGAMADVNDRLTYSAGPSQDAAAISEGLTQLIAMGLVRYGVEAGLGRDLLLEISPRLLALAAGTAAGAGAAEVQEAYDPWNYWVFQLGLSGDVDIEENRENIRWNPNFGVDRVTENWKFNFGVDFSLRRDRRTIPATSTSSAREIINDRKDWGLNALIVKSISGHMSTGVDFGMGNSVQNNYQSRITVAPGIEWNYYPYSEQNRRQLIAHYAAGAQYNNYTEATILGALQETVPIHKVGIQYRASEDWGNAGVSLNASQYLHEGGLYSFGVNGNLGFRIVRGLDLNLTTSAEKIADQIYIPASDLADEDILLGRTALPTGYEYQFSIGLNYRFGSSFSTVVNSRMQGLGGGGFGGGGGGRGFR